MELKYSKIIGEEKIGNFVFCHLECECGKNYKRRKYDLKLEGLCRSCTGKKKNIKHGMSGTAIYALWRSMRQRCENPKASNYYLYGGRGIKVCDRWQIFEQFFKDMGERPKGMSLDRKDNNGDYYPENCKWSTRPEQNKNKRNNRFVMYRGKKYSLVDLARQYAIKRTILYSRIFVHNWSVDKALTVPIGAIKPNQKVA